MQTRRGCIDELSACKRSRPLWYPSEQPESADGSKLGHMVRAARSGVDGHDPTCASNAGCAQRRRRQFGVVERPETGAAHHQYRCFEAAGYVRQSEGVAESYV